MRRLKGLDEFETPLFVGRMERVRRLRLWLWRLMLVVAVAVGVLVGLLLF
jgi:hypothetical protein